MLVKMKNKLQQVTINYAYLLGDWVNLFEKDFLGNFYMNNLMSFLFTMYKEKPDKIRPNKKFVFTPFQKCSYKDVKVVLVTEYPTITVKGNGLGVGNNKTVMTNYQITSELGQIKKCIEDTIYNGMRVTFDNTLANWAIDEDILCLNTALTCSSTENDAHKEYWHLFIKEVLSTLSNKKDGLVFAFIGDACKYAHYVNDDSNFVLLEKESINECIKNKKIWMSDIFNEIDNTLISITRDQSSAISW